MDVVCHCEAIQSEGTALDCFAALAMTEFFLLSSETPFRGSAGFIERIPRTGQAG